MRDRTIIRYFQRLAIGVCACAVLLAAFGSNKTVAQDYTVIIAAPDRSETDRQTDQRRNPVKLLAFTGVRAGMKVLDMGAGGGYSTELMARGVGATGVVYGQDSADASQRAKDTFEARSKTPAMKNVIRLVRNFDDPVPPDVRNLNLITFFFFYHDTTYMNVDRAAMNRKLYAALKRGGILVIADHSARQGDGVSVGKTLHRIEESVLRREVEAAGFKLVAQGSFLKHTEDPRNEPVFQPKVPVDEFVLKFQKPR